MCLNVFLFKFLRYFYLSYFSFSKMTDNTIFTMYVCVCVCLYRAFLEIGSLEFSDFLHDDVTSSNLKSDEARFFEKNLIRPFWAKMADFWPKFAQK